MPFMPSDYIPFANYSNHNQTLQLFKLNTLTTVGTSLGVFLRLWIPFLIRISTSALS